MDNESYKLLKFRYINKYLIESLVSSSLYFASPETLNDPFDCQCDIEKSLMKAIDETDSQKKDLLLRVKKDRIIKSIETLTKPSGICCFSDPKILKNTLMWAHYADSHKGLCVQYDIPADFFDKKSDIIAGIAPVEYGDNLLRGWLKGDGCDLLSSLSGDKDFVPFGVELLKKRYCIKDTNWKYEKEIRIIKKIAGSLKIPRKFLVSVYFGLRTPQSDIELIESLLVNDSIDFFKMTQDESDYGICPVPRP